MSICLDKKTQVSSVPTSLRIFEEDGAVYGAEPIEEVFSFKATDYVTASALSWNVPVDTKVNTIIVSSLADLSGQSITIGISTLQNVILWQVTVPFDDFTKEGTFYTLQLPFPFINKGLVFGFIATADLARIEVEAKRISILPDILPKQ